LLALKIAALCSELLADLSPRQAIAHTAAIRQALTCQLRGRASFLLYDLGEVAYLRMLLASVANPSLVVPQPP
jgi:hypothetical protein